jgi:hypothetical protein
MTFLRRLAFAVTFLVVLPILIGCQNDDHEQNACESLSTTAAVSRADVSNAAENRLCIANEDCLAVYHRLSCFADCGEPLAVSLSRQEDVATAVAAVEGETCGKYWGEGCLGPIQLPCPQQTVEALAVCHQGQCLINYPSAD